MRVGILTFHNTPNFGASLQCAALARYISHLGHDVEVINYAPLRTRHQYLKWMFTGQNASIRNVGRMWNLRQFRKQHYRLSGGPILSHAALTRHCGARYDALVIGSDELWKENGLRPFDTAFFGAFADPERTRIIAYAPSASMDSALGRKVETVTPLLNCMTAVSARDENTAEELRQHYGIKAPLVVDPTLLEPFTAETPFKAPYPRYLAVYAGSTQEQTAALRRFADLNDLKIVGIGYDEPGFDKCYLALGPGEWLSLIRQSTAVFTHFYHGVIFALIYGKPLYAYVDGSKQHKVGSLMTQIGLQHLLHPTPNSIAEMRLNDLTYPASHLARLDPLVARSRSYLEKALAP